MLEARMVSYRHKASLPWLFEDINVRILPGETMGICGDSGVGKSTLAKVIGGYLEAEYGKVTICGEDLPAKGFYPVQLIFQHPELSVNPRWKISRIISEGREPSEDMINMLGIKESWMDRYPHELSGGELQRIVVARALGPETKYLIADEMTSMLDSNTQARIWNAVRYYQKRYNMGIIAISHDTPLLERISDSILQFKEKALREWNHTYN